MGGGGGAHMTGQVEHSLIQRRLTGGTTSTRRWSSEAMAGPARGKMRRMKKRVVVVECSMAEIQVWLR